VKLLGLLSRLRWSVGATAPPPSGHDAIVVTKVDDPRPFVAELFRRTFGDLVPTAPTHYVAFCTTASGVVEAVGYYHVAYCGEYALVGGLCVDQRMRRRGIGEKLERYVYGDAGATKAYFAHVGDPTRARRVGFEDTGKTHLVVCWIRDVPEDERDHLIAKVDALGPF